MIALIKKLQNVIYRGDLIFLALYVFNVSTKHFLSLNVSIVAKYCRSAKTSKMGDNTITAPSNLSKDAVDEKMAKIFFINFDSSPPREKVLRKTR